jgi:hypothetical protein
MAEPAYFATLTSSTENGCRHSRAPQWTHFVSSWAVSSEHLGHGISIFQKTVRIATASASFWHPVTDKHHERNSLTLSVEIADPSSMYSYHFGDASTVIERGPLVRYQSPSSTFLRRGGFCGGAGFDQKNQPIIPSV